MIKMFLRNSQFLKQWNSLYVGKKYLSCNTAVVTKIHRSTYARVYPTLLVFPDGSTVTIRFHEPRMIIKLPVDLSTLNDVEKKIRIEGMKPKQRVKFVEVEKSTFDPKRYAKMIKKK